MKRLLTFLTLLTIFIGVGWATTVTKTMTEIATANSWVTASGNGDQTCYTSFNLDANITISTTGDPNCGSYWGSDWRLYQAQDGNVIITAATGYSLQSVTFIYSVKNGGVLKFNNNSITSGTVCTISGNSTEFAVGNTGSATSGQVRITEISVTYTDGGTTPEPTTFALTLPTGLTGGTVTSNYSGDLTQIASGTSITVTATPATGYTLEYMKANGEVVSNPYTFNINANTTIDASFVEEPTPSIDEYELVSDISQLSAGDKIIIASTRLNGSGYAISTTQASSNRPATSVTIANAKITSPSDAVQIITLEKEGDNWLFNVGNGYLYASSSTANQLKTETTPDANAKATISISSNAATITFQGSNTRNLMRYNPNSGGSNRLYACYASNSTTGTLPFIYKKVESTPQSSDVYIIGQVNGHDSDPWVSTEGVQLTYNSTNDNYSADIYCTGVNNGTHEGYSLFLFAKSLPYDWNTTSNLYGSGADGSYWGIGGTNESAFGDEIPLYEGSKNSYRLPAGLYTVTVDLDYTGHQYTTKSVKVTKRDVTMTISPNSSTFEDTKNVTMSSNLTDIGGKIYYTTNGNDPRDPNSGRIEYTGELTIDATTTFKAVAFIGNLYSEVVEKTYTKTPAAPVITPNGGTIYEATQVTITAEEGATIYYTTDGNTPTPENGTQYTAPFTVSATTTVKARAYVGDVYSSITTAEFTYSDVQPSTGDFVLVTSASQLVAGNEYIIINSDRTAAAAGYSSSKFGVTDNFTLSNDYSTATPGNDVKIFTLEAGNESGAFYMKDDSNNYYYPSTGGTDINTGKELVYISYSDGFTYIKGSTTSTRSIAYNHQASNHVFGSYTNPTTTGNQRPVYLYTRESNSVQPPVFTPAGGVYDVPVDVTISCATTGASIYYTTDGTEPSATNGTLYDGEEFVVSKTTTCKAVAVKNGNTSSVVTAEYTIAPHTAIETVTLDYSEPFTAGIGKFTVQNVSGFAPVWTLDGEFGIKGTSYSANTNPTNNAAESRFLSPIIDMTDATQPELTFSHQINSYFTNVTNQCQLFIRETTDGTDGTWIQLPITFSDPAANGGWTNDVVDIDLTDVNGVSYAGKKVQISFLYTNPTAGSGAGTWEIQNFVVADNSEYKMVNNIAEFLALENGTKAKFRNPVTVLYDYAQHSSNSYHEYIWVKDESGYMQFYLIPTLNSSTESDLSAKAAYYENGDIIPAGFVVVKNYYENGKFVQAYSADALEAGFLPSTQKGLADPEYMDFDVLDDLDASNTTDVANWSNHYITLEKIKLTSSSKNFNFQDENENVNACVGYNKYNGDGSLLKDGTTSADVIMPTDLTKFYNVKGIIQLWKGGWEFMPIEFTEWKPAEVTLRKLCADGVEQNTYTISNPLQVVYVDTESNSVWVKDGTGQSIWSTSPEAPNAENFAIDYPANTRSQQAYYDQSNWCQLVFDGEIPTALANHPIINGGKITGEFTNKMNPTLENVELGENFVQTSTSSYTTNYYLAANFNGPQKGYFFMNPKPQEYADIVWAIYDSSNNSMIMTTNSSQNYYGFEGSFKVDMSMNINPSLQLVDGIQTGEGYEHFKAIIRLASTGSNAPMLKGAPTGTEYVVFPLDITQDVPTGINTVDVTGKAVKSVKFYNVAGIESATPFQGVNIVVTEYTDGTRSTSKVLRR